MTLKGDVVYQHLLEVLANPKDEEHADMKLWAPRGFDAEKFDLVAVTKELATLSKRVTATSRSTISRSLSALVTTFSPRRLMSRRMPYAGAVANPYDASAAPPGAPKPPNDRRWLIVGLGCASATLFVGSAFLYVAWQLLHPTWRVVPGPKGEAPVETR